MIKSIKAIMRQDREPYRVPRRVQDMSLLMLVTIHSQQLYHGHLKAC